MKNLISTLIFLLSLAINTINAQEMVSTKYGVKIPEYYTAAIDEIYTEVNGWLGRIDIYYNLSATKPTPLIINIHGGAWTHGEKESQGNFKNYLKKGFAVANVEYRMSGTAKAPAAIEDVRCAFLYMIKNAEKFNIDTNRIVIMGGSAGGHLALMVGLLGKNPLFDKECSGTKGVKVAAIIDKYGITDLTSIEKGTWKNRSAVGWLDKNADNVKFLASISPITYLSQDSPPVFVVHGDADPIVPYEQSYKLYKKLKKLGVKNQFMSIKGGLHGKFKKEDEKKVSQAIIDFLIQLKIIE